MPHAVPSLYPPWIISYINKVPLNFRISFSFLFSCKRRDCLQKSLGMSKLTLKMDLWKVEKDGALRVQLVPTRESQGQAVAPLRQQPLLSRRMRQLLYRWAQCSASWPYLEWNCWPVLAGLFWRRRLEKWALRSLAKKRLKRITKVWHDFFLPGILSNFV